MMAPRCTASARHSRPGLASRPTSITRSSRQHSPTPSRTRLSRPMPGRRIWIGGGSCYGIGRGIVAARRVHNWCPPVGWADDCHARGHSRHTVLVSLSEPYVHGLGKAIRLAVRSVGRRDQAHSATLQQISIDIVRHVSCSADDDVARRFRRCIIGSLNRERYACLYLTTRENSASFKRLQRRGCRTRKHTGPRGARLGLDSVPPVWFSGLRIHVFIDAWQKPGHQTRKRQERAEPVNCLNPVAVG